MEDYGNYIYFIVFGIIVISNIIGGRKKKQQQKQQQSKPKTSNTQTPKSWEDILREMQGEVKKTPQPQPAPARTVKTVSKQPKPVSLFDPSKEGQRSITMPVADETPIFAETNEEFTALSKDFHDLDTLKRAFVMSEILTRKY